jgi:hypothetical protein
MPATKILREVDAIRRGYLRGDAGDEWRARLIAAVDLPVLNQFQHFCAFASRTLCGIDGQ